MRRVALAAALLVGCGDDVTSTGETDAGTSGTSGRDGSTETTDTPVDPDGGSSSGGCALEIVCPGIAPVECMGGQTPVSIEAPTVCPEHAVSSDAPAGYPLGTTAVTFTASDGAAEVSCVVEVTVEDTVAPSLLCPESGVLLRTEVGSVPAPAVAPSDVCGVPSLTVTPELLDESGTVLYEAVDPAGNAASCATDFTLVDAFAVSGFRVLSASAVDADTEVTFGWEPPQSEAVESLRLEVAMAEDGPWSEVTTLDPGAQLHAQVLSDPSAYYRLVSVTAYGDGGASPAQRVFRLGADGYDVRDVAVPNVPFETTLYGVVRHPVALDEGPFPLVVVMHGNHGNCRANIDDPFDYCVTTTSHDCADPGGVTTPNAEGYIYFLETLAAQGYIAVSISGNAMNCRNDFIFERAELIGEHLRAWSSWNAADAGETQTSFVGAVDLGRVGLVGHSRGGDAASNVPGLLEATPIPGVEVRSVFAVAPTDYHDVQVPGADLAVLLPGCDRDVESLVGMNHYDRSIDLDDGARRAQVLLLGMNHNFFNAQWQISDWDLFGNPNDPFCAPDDEPLALSQRHTLEALLGSWFAQTLAGPGEPERFMQAREAGPSSVDLWAESELQMRWSYWDGSGVMLDDFEAAGAPQVNALGEANSFSDWFLYEACFENGCDPYFNHVKTVARLLWQVPAEPLASFGLGGYDASGHEAIVMRVVSRRSLLNQGLEENDFWVRLRDAGGGEAEVLVSDAKRLGHLYPHSDPLEVMETFALELSWFEGVDLGALQSLELDMTATGLDGSVIVSDLGFL